MPAHNKQHPINAIADHAPGTVGTLLGTDAGPVLAEKAFGTAVVAGNIVQRVAVTGDVLVPTVPGSGASAASKDYVDSMAGGGATYEFVVAPSAAAVGNVYTTLATTLTAAQAQVATGGSVQAVVLFVAENVTTAGGGNDFDFSHLILNADPVTYPTLTLASNDGVAGTPFTLIENMFFTFSGTEAHQGYQITGYAEVHIDWFTLIQCAVGGSFGPLYVVSSTGTLQLILNNLSTIGDNASPVVSVAAGGTVLVELGSGCTLKDNWVSGAGDVTIHAYPGSLYPSVSGLSGFTGTLTVFPQFEQLASVPGSGTLVNPVEFTRRFVYGYVTLAATAGNAASIDFFVENAGGTYDLIQRISQPATDTAQRDHAYSFGVPPQRTWKYVVGGLAGVIETVATYSWIDY